MKMGNTRSHMMLLLVLTATLMIQNCICQVQRGVCVLQVARNSSISVQGTLVLNQNSVQGTVRGLEANKNYAMYVHEFGDLRLGGSKIGGHFTVKADAIHSTDMNNQNRHIGDMGQITANQQGTANVNRNNMPWQLQGTNSIIGRAIVIHSEPDANDPPNSPLAFCVVGIQRTEAVNVAIVDSGANIQYGTCEMRGASLDSKIRGRVTFEQVISNDLFKGVQVRAKICGLSNGYHGFHVHTFGDLTNMTYNTGDHYSPYTGVKLPAHKYPNAVGRHRGDMGNLISSGSTALYSFRLDSQASVNGQFGFIGRSVVITADPDWGESKQPDGDSGEGIAHCVIGISNQAKDFSDINCNSGVKLASGLTIPIVVAWCVVTFVTSL